MKLTRRDLAKVAPAILSPVVLQAQQPATTADAELQAARDRLKTNADALNTIKVPMDTEPAFQFKA
jgi:hypothetical protein